MIPGAVLVPTGQAPRAVAAKARRETEAFALHGQDHYAEGWVPSEALGYWWIRLRRSNDNEVIRLAVSRSRLTALEWAARLLHLAAQNDDPKVLRRRMASPV